MHLYNKYNTIQCKCNIIKCINSLIQMATANILGHSTNPARFVHFNPAGLHIDLNQIAVHIDLNA